MHGVRDKLILSGYGLKKTPSPATVFIELQNNTTTMKKRSAVLKASSIIWFR